MSFKTILFYQDSFKTRSHLINVNTSFFLIGNIFNCFLNTLISCNNDKSKNYYMQLTAIVKQENNWGIGWIEEISGINCQERTK